MAAAHLHAYRLLLQLYNHGQSCPNPELNASLRFHTITDGYKSFTLLYFLHKFFIKIIYRKWLSMTRVKDINIQLFQFIYAFVKVFKIIDIIETCEIVN